MANDILSVKLHELDRKISLVYSRILMTETADHETIRKEKNLLRTECEETERTLHEKLEFSKSNAVSEIRTVYEGLAEIAGPLRANMNDICRSSCEADPSLSSDELSERTEEKILLAEYALDFAMLAADHSLLLAMDALDSQMTKEEREAVS